MRSVHWVFLILVADKMTESEEQLEQSSDVKTSLDTCYENDTQPIVENSEVVRDLLDSVPSEEITFEGYEFQSMSSDSSVVEPPDVVMDHLQSVEKTAKDNQSEIIILRSALADALRRLCLLEEEVEQYKQNSNPHQRKNSLVKTKPSSQSSDTSPSHGSKPLPGHRKAKSLSCFVDPPPKSPKKAVVRTKSTGSDLQSPQRKPRISRDDSFSDNELNTPTTRSRTRSETHKNKLSETTNNKNKAPSSAAKKRFSASFSSQEDKAKENDSKDTNNGKPKIILAKKTPTKSLKRGSSVVDENTNGSISRGTSGDDSVKFNTRGRALILYPPSSFQDENSDISAPDRKLKLGWIYGYRGKDCRNNLHYIEEEPSCTIESGEVVYNMAGVVTVHDVSANTQRHYTEHNDDVKCIAIHPNKTTVASGQVAGHGEDKRPHVRVWNSVTMETLSSFGQGVFERGLCAVAFSTYENGKYLIAFDEGNDHVIYLYEWEKGIKLTETKVSKELLFGAMWNPTQSSELSFATYGKSHLMFWNMCIEPKGVHLTKKAAIYDKISKPKYVHSIVYLPNGDIVSGDSNGNILLFKDENTRNKVSLSALSAHKGGVFCISYIQTKETILSCGKDGQLSMWSTALEKLSDFSRIPEQYGAARTMLHNPLNDHYLIGTAKNSILEYDCECLSERTLVLGHHDEMWGVATHSTKPLFASCANEQLVCVWDSKTKQNTWSYYIEDEAQCVEFHPMDHYLLVGTKSGTIYFFNYVTKEEELTATTARDVITDIKVSPNGEMFAVGCRDKNIYLYSWPDEVTAIRKPRVLQAHTSKVTHIDWSLDSEFLQSNSSDCELLYWSAEAALQILSPSELRDVVWATWTCPYGFSSMGIWKDGETDINACSRSSDMKLIATADTGGEVKVFRYPCTKARAEGSVGVGHSSHVTCVRFLADDKGMVSVGGQDCSIMQWYLE